MSFTPKVICCLRCVFILILLSTVSVAAYGQTRKTHFPIWTFHQRNIRIDGVSVGLWNFSEQPKNTTTNGIRLSLVGEGLLVPFLPKSPVPENDSAYQAFKDSLNASRYSVATEKINGINLASTGNLNSYIINGITAGFIGQFNYKVNGISGAALNFSSIHNGVQSAVVANDCIQMSGMQVAFFTNNCYKMNGLQIGLINKSKRTRGIQIGIWNINEHRKLPLINWSFR